MLFHLYEYGILRQTFKAKPQIVMPNLFKQLVLHIAYYFPLLRHPDERGMQYQRQRLYNWLALPLDRSSALERCRFCSLSRKRLSQMKETIPLLRTGGPLVRVLSASRPIDPFKSFTEFRAYSYWSIHDANNSRFYKMCHINRARSWFYSKMGIIWNGPLVDLISENRFFFTGKFSLDVFDCLNAWSQFMTTTLSTKNEMRKGTINPEECITVVCHQSFLNDDAYAPALTYTTNW